MNDLKISSNADIATSFATSNPFEVAFQPAKPILDAVEEMRGPLAWLNRRRGRRSYDPKEIVKEVPLEADLLRVKDLFRQAEHDPAPEAWAGIAVALAADSMPPAHRVSDAWVCAIVDGAYHDDAWQGDYQLGFSYAVIARSVRQALRLDGLPTPGAFLDRCNRDREQFWRWRGDVITLIGIRSDLVHGPCPF